MWHLCDHFKDPFAKKYNFKDIFAKNLAKMAFLFEICTADFSQKLDHTYIIALVFKQNFWQKIG
jgi:hypothetical protein